MKEFYSVSEVADIMSVTKETVRRWEKQNIISSIRNEANNYRYFHADEIKKFAQGKLFLESVVKKTNPKPLKNYKSVELFAGAGGLALGLEKSGFEHSALVEINKDACRTLRKNRPNWNVIEGDITDIGFHEFKDIDLLTGGFPCQAFSYAGKRLGFDDTRGTLFFEFARAIQECTPKIIIAENVRGLLTHDNGRTIKTIIDVLENDLGYTVYSPEILKAIFYKVPQKRERLIIVAIRSDLSDKMDFSYPKPYNKIYTLKDALKKGELFDEDVPYSAGQKYPLRKKEIMNLVPPGGYWRDLPLELQKEYMQGSFFLGGGKTGMARRISWDEPCLTLTCAPAQKQTERCHPEETRPFTVREYARIQTFPDEWIFEGSMSSQYKQIGNAVPVNLAREIGFSIIDSLNQYYISK